MHPLQSFFDNYAFGDPRAFGPPDAGNMVLYSTSVMAQQGPGVEFSQFHSSTYGPHGVRHAALPCKCAGNALQRHGMQQKHFQGSKPYVHIQVYEHQMRLKDSQTGHEEIIIGRQLGDKVTLVLAFVVSVVLDCICHVLRPACCSTVWLITCAVSCYVQNL